MNRKRLIIIFCILIGLLVIGSIVVEAGFMDDAKDLFKPSAKNKKRWKYVGVNALIAVALVVIISPLMTPKIEDKTQKYMLQIGLSLLAVVLVWNAYKNPDYTALYLWEFPFVHKLLHVKPMVNVAIVFGILFWAYLYWIEKEANKMPGAKWIAGALILVLAMHLAGVNDAPDKRDEYKNYDDKWIWNSEKIAPHRTFLLGDPFCKATVGKPPNEKEKTHCYVEKSIANLKEKGEYIDNIPKGLSPDVVRWGVLRGEHLMILVIGFALFLWLFETMKIANEGGGKHINKLIAAVIAGTLANNGTGMASFITMAQIITIVVFSTIFGVKEDIKTTGAWSKTIAGIKILFILWIVTTISAAVGVEGGLTSLLGTILYYTLGISLIVTGAVLGVVLMLAILLAVTIGGSTFIVYHVWTLARNRIRGTP